MIFAITSITSGARVGDLTAELRDLLECQINEKYLNVECTLYIAIICVSKTKNMKSKSDYDSKAKKLEIEVAVDVEEYRVMYKVEQRHNLGNTFLEQLELALNTYPIEGLDKEQFISDIVKWGRAMEIQMDNGGIRINNWFGDEIDWSADLDK